MTLRSLGDVASKLWLGLALTLFWPAAYFAIYIPLIVPNDAWEAARACLWILTSGYAVLLGVAGVRSRLREVLLASTAIAISTALFTRLATASHFPAFGKGPNDLADAFHSAVPLAILAGAVMLGAKGVSEILRSRARRHAA